MLIEFAVSKNYAFLLRYSLYTRSSNAEPFNPQKGQKSAEKSSSRILVSDEMEFARKPWSLTKMLVAKTCVTPNQIPLRRQNVWPFSGYFFVPQHNGMRVSEWLEVSTFCSWLDLESPKNLYKCIYKYNVITAFLGRC